MNVLCSFALPARRCRKAMKRIRSHGKAGAMILWSVFLPLAVVFTPTAASGADSAAIPAPAYERIISLGPLITENIFLLGAGDSLVGNTIYCQRPKAALRKTKVGSVQELSIEKIVSLKPQLILANNLTPPQQIEKMRRLGLRVELFSQPASFADICEHFLRLGRILGLEERAGAIVDQVRHKVETVRQAVAPLPRRRVFLQVGAHPLYSSIKSSFTNDFIELGGGINIAGEQFSGLVKIEQVIALNPELIIIAVMGSEDGIGAAEKKRWLGFNTIEAARNKQVHVMDPDLVCSPSPPTFADTLAHIARLIHPEAVIPVVETHPRM
jgi:iron complex transport system substrate-binding protein